jgi:hypothetical protein
VIRYVEEPIVGRISVQKGNHPAVAITFGIIAGVASGLVKFDGLFAAYLTLPGPGGQDELQYRYESLEWMNAVNDRARAT